MSKKFPQEGKKFEIQAFKRPKDLRDLGETHVPFSGSPYKHPYDPEKVLLVTDPYSTNTSYFEFKVDDISYVEELPSLVDLEGRTVTMTRIWIRKRSVGVLCMPFVVEGTKAARNTPAKR
jgi:hypothetical protein